MDVDLSKDDWYAEFERLAEFWLGPRSVGFGYSNEVVAAHELPEGLRWFLQFGGRWPHPETSTVGSINAFSTTNVIDVPDAAAPIEHGLVRFGRAPQGSFAWATLATDAPDAPVYGSSAEEPVVAGIWDLYWNSLDDFLRTTLVGSLTQIWWASGSTATSNPIVRDLVDRLGDGCYLADDRLYQERLDATFHLVFDDLATEDWIIVRRSDEAFAPTLSFRSADARQRFLTWLGDHGIE